MNEEKSQFRRVIIIFILVTTLLVVYYTSPRIPYPANPPTETVTPIQLQSTWTPSFTPPSEAFAFYYEANLEGFGSYRIEELYPGAMDFEYPVYLLPGSSEIVTLTISPNVDLGTSLPEIFQRIPVPPDIPLQMGEYHHHSSNILFAPEMRATLSSEGISVVALDDPKKFINLGSAALWLWSIGSPAQVGTHPLLLRLYFGDNQDPIWSFSFTLSITHPTETPLPTATATLPPTQTPSLIPSPTYTPTKTRGERIEDSFIDKAPETLAAIVGFIGVVVGAILGRASAQRSKEKSEGLAPEKSEAKPAEPSKGESPKSARGNKQKGKGKNAPGE